jgi:tetratricopeptide (TPR) repeat protein
MPAVTAHHVNKCKKVNVYVPAANQPDASTTSRTVARHDGNMPQEESGMMEAENNQAVQPTVIDLFKAGKFADMETLAHRQLDAAPNDGIAWKALGVALKMQGKDAMDALQRAADLLPDDAQAQFNCGVALHDAKDLDKAVGYYKRSIELDPANFRALNNLGNALRDMGDLTAAEAMYRKALISDPDFAEAHYNLGFLLQDKFEHEKAIPEFLEAIKLSPNHLNARINLAHCYSFIGMGGEAAQHYQEALRLSPRSADAKNGFAGLLLSHENYATGLELYEARLELPTKNGLRRIPDLPFPQWKGEPLNGKKILIYHEQGFGDAIQLIRYAAELKRLGAHVTLLTTKQLATLMQTAKGLDHIVLSAEDAQDSDYYILMFSIPYRMGTRIDTIPNGVPYLRAQSDRVEAWRNRFAGPGLKVGIQWAGNPSYANDRNRSLPSNKILAPLWEIKNVTFYSLHRGQEDPTPMIPLGPETGDFGETAAILQNLDLVISVDTAFAHLAGALGRPVWIMLSAKQPDWRWHRNRTDSPWYPTAKLYRQKVPGDWGEVIAKIACDLTKIRQ